MPLKKYPLFLSVLILAALFMRAPLSTPAVQAQALSGLNSNLYFLAPDGSGITQLWMLDSADAVTQITTEASPITAYDIAFDGRLVYATATTLNINGMAITSGDPLGNAALKIADVAWSPTGQQVAVVIVSADGTANQLEGVWLYNADALTGKQELSSVRTGDNNQKIYLQVEWAAGADRLLMQTQFFESEGVTLYSLATQTLQTYNKAGTGDRIDSLGYTTGHISMDGSKLIITDVPLAPVGDGFIVDINDYGRIVRLADAEAGGRYLSHAQPIVGGVAFFIRNLNDPAETWAETWQLTYQGARVAMGRLPSKAITEAEWNDAGNALVYLDAEDENNIFARLLVWQGEISEERQLPIQATYMQSPQFGPAPRLLTGTTYQTHIVITEPLTAGQGTSGPVYNIKAQWISFSEGDSYQIKIVPGIAEQETFAVQGVAVQLNHLPCGNNYNLTVAPLQDGTPGTESAPVNFSTPPCDVIPAMPAAQSGTAEQPAAEQSAEQPAAEQPVEQPAAEQPATEFTGELAPATNFTAGSDFQPKVLEDGTTTVYAVTLSWIPAQSSQGYFLLLFDKPIGTSTLTQRPVINRDNPVNYTLEDLVCGTTYTLHVQTMGSDGTTLGGVTPEIQITTPDC